MTDHTSLPPSFELPPGRLIERRRHLLDEIARERSQHRTIWRPALALVLALITLAAVAGPTLALSRTVRQLVGLSSNPPTARNWVQATLTSPVPLKAKAGTQVTISWKLSGPDQSGQRQPFDGMGIFARLIGSPGEPIESAATHGSNGQYSATLTIPAGGIRRIEIGIFGRSIGPTGHHPAPVLFPITNSPIRR